MIYVKGLCVYLAPGEDYESFIWPLVILNEVKNLQREKAMNHLLGSDIRGKSGGLWDMTNRAQVITFIGAGGKTTSLKALTKEIESAGQRVIATTTTKVFPMQDFKDWRNTAPPPSTLDEACFWYTQIEDESGKWLGPPLQTIDDAIAADFHPKRFWVIEGDGARELKLKCWAPHEPQIPQRTRCAVLVLDRGLWGKVLLADQVHRWEHCPNLLGQVWNAERAWNYFFGSPVFAPQYKRMDWVILLNGPGKYVESESVLQKLSQRWVEIQQDVKDLNTKPGHLRLAAGDAKEGKLQWFDLW